MLNLSQFLRYSIAIAAVLFALLLMLALDPALQFSRASYLSFFGAVTISALYGGRTPGIVATLLSAGFANYFFVAPQHSWILSFADVLRMALFITQGVLISVLIGSLQTAQAQAAHSFNQLKVTEAEIRDLNQTLQQRVDELRESQALFEAFMDHLPATAYIKDEAGRYLYVNPRNEHLCNRPLADWVGKTDFDLFPQAEAQQWHDHDLVALTSGAAIEIEETFHQADGEHCYTSFKFPIRHPSGRPLVGGISLDVTERKRNEVERQQAAAAIRQLNQQLQERVTELQTLLAVIPIGIGIAEDRECGTIRANPAFARLLNLPSTANISLSAPAGERPTFKVYQNGRELAPEALSLQYAAQHGVEVNEFEVEVVWEDGTVRSLLEYAAPLFNKSGQPRGSIGAFLDITERKQAEAERIQLLEREQAARASAERANRIKDEFLSILSHELRSPLNPILGWSRLLQTKTYDPAKTMQALVTIERNARLQTQLIDDLLDVARILRGKLSLEEAPVNLVPVIEAALEVVRTAAEAKSIVLQPDLIDIGLVKGDSGRLQQIVWNLLANAIKFTPPGGQVHISLSQVQTAAQIRITDTGKGISPEFLPHIFESFRQEDPSITRQHGGLGLGLSIVKYLVDAHGGTIVADSPGEGQGATFAITLPLLQSDPLTVSANQSGPGLAIDLTGLKVLAVDDSEDSRELLTALLTQYGAEARVVTSGAEVLALLSYFKPQVLLCDIGMPELDGYTLLQQIRTLPPEQGGSIPAIAVTAYAQEADHQRAINLGFQRHIAKPIDPAILAATIAELVQPSQLPDAAKLDQPNNSNPSGRSHG